MIEKYGKLLGLVLGCASIAPARAMMGNKQDDQELGGVEKTSDYLELPPEIWGGISDYTDRQSTLNLKLCSKYFRDIVDAYGKSIKFKGVFDINGSDKINLALKFLQRSDHYSTLYLNFIFNDFLPTEEQLEELFKKYPNAQFQIALTEDNIQYTSIPNFYNRTVNKVEIQCNQNLAKKLLSIDPVDNTALSSNFLTTALLNNKLVELTLAQTYLASYKIISLANILKGNKSLTALNLSRNQIGGDEANAISEALKENKSLTMLDLGWNKIGAAGANAVSDALKENKSLTTLDLSWNNIGDDGAKDISDVLKVNKFLVMLNLRRNQIGNYGAKKIIEALKENTSLATLDLGYNEIGDDGANAISEALKENTSLTMLDLSWNNIRAAGANAISEALKENTYLTKLDLDWNQIGDAGANAISEALKENTYLRVFT